MAGEAMKWELRRVDPLQPRFEETIAALLEDGWEPFAVVQHVVYFRRQR